MYLMLDTNILLDHIGRREPFYELSRRACLLGIYGEARTYITASMVTDLFYLLRKDFGSCEAQRMIEEDLSFLKVVGVSADNVADALSRKNGPTSRIAWWPAAPRKSAPITSLPATRRTFSVHR